MGPTTIRFPGSGQRIALRLKALGYWNDKRQRPMVMQFCLKYRYTPQYVYEWLRGALPSHANLMRLARDLETTPWYLLFGVDGCQKPGRKLGRRT